MNFAKSNYGKFPAPSSMTRKIAHNDPKLILTTTQKGPQGEVTSKLVYTTDGKECVNTVRGGEWTSTTTWDGNSVEVASKRTINGAEVTTKERWTLTAKGKVLTVVNNTVTPQATVTFTVVMDKQ